MFPKYLLILMCFGCRATTLIQIHLISLYKGKSCEFLQTYLEAMQVNTFKIFSYKNFVEYLKVTADIPYLHLV